MITVSRPGPRLVDALEELLRLLHPASWSSKAMKEPLRFPPDLVGLPGAGSCSAASASSGGERDDHPGRNLEAIRAGGKTTAGTILGSLRLPRTILIAMTGAARARQRQPPTRVLSATRWRPLFTRCSLRSGLGRGGSHELQMVLPTLRLMGRPAGSLCCWFTTVMVVYFLARVGKGAAAFDLDFSRVAVSSFAAALTSFLMLRAEGELRRALAWLLGGATMSGLAGRCWRCCPYWLIGIGISAHNWACAQRAAVAEMSRLQQLGLPVERVRRLTIIAAFAGHRRAVSFAGILASSA